MSTMFQWSDDYNAQTILDQVFEAPYSWFRLIDTNHTHQDTGIECLGVVGEIDEYDDDPDHVVDHWHVTAEMIDNVIIPTYTAFMNIPPDHPRFESFAHWIEDLDANDVDIILQMACFGEIRYG